jgi:hypothetical protein
MTLEVDDPIAEAGMALIQNDRSALLFTLSGGGELRLVHNRNGDVSPLAKVNYEGQSIHLKVTGDYLDLGFYYSADGTNWQTLVSGVDGSVLAPERIGGYNYTGAYVGLYGTTNGAGEGRAAYAFMEYRPTMSDPNNWFYRRQSK